MDLDLVMEKLAPSENVSSDMSSYQSMVDHWRGINPPPTLQEVNDKWAEIEAEVAAQSKINSQSKLDALWDKVANMDSVKMDEIKAAEIIVK